MPTGGGKITVASDRGAYLCVPAGWCQRQAGGALRKRSPDPRFLKYIGTSSNSVVLISYFKKYLTAFPINIRSR